MKNIKAYIKAFKYIISIISFKENKIENLNFVDKKYIGLDNKHTAVRVFYAKNKLAQSIVIFPGASPYAEKHPSVIMLGNALQNAGYNVYLPRIPDLKNLIINKKNIDWFAHCYNELANKHIQFNHNIMVVGLSFGGATLIKACQDPRMQNPKPKSILSYGTYYSMDSALNFLISGKISYKNKNYLIKPHEWGIIVMFYNFISTIKTNYNVEKIKEILKDRIEDKFDLVDKKLKTLRPAEEKLTKNIINGIINDEIIHMTKEIVSINQNLFKLLSPINWVGSIKNKVFIIHGANDSMVPFTESYLLHKNLVNSEILISFLYEHKEMSTNKGLLFKLKEFKKMISFFAKYFKYNL